MPQCRTLLKPLLTSLILGTLTCLVPSHRFCAASIRSETRHTQHCVFGLHPPHPKARSFKEYSYIFPCSFFMNVDSPSPYHFFLPHIPLHKAQARNGRNPDAPTSRIAAPDFGQLPLNQCFCHPTLSANAAFFSGVSPVFNLRIP